MGKSNMTAANDVMAKNWDYEEKKELYGEILEFRHGIGVHSGSVMLVAELDDDDQPTGDTYSVWLKKVLENIILEGKNHFEKPIPVGATVLVKYEGKGISKKFGEYVNFSVKVDPSTMDTGMATKLEPVSKEEVANVPAAEKSSASKTAQSKSVEKKPEQTKTSNVTSAELPNETEDDLPF